MEQQNLNKIEHFKEQKPFNVPDDYFEEFALQMQHSIKNYPFYFGCY